MINPTDQERQKNINTIKLFSKIFSLNMPKQIKKLKYFENMKSISNSKAFKGNNEFNLTLEQKSKFEL